MRRPPLSLKRSALMRLVVITVAAVLIFYAIGLYLNSVGINNLRAGLQNGLEAETRYCAGEIEREINNLILFEQELATSSRLLRYTIAYGVLSDYERVESIETLYDQLLRIKRFSPLVQRAIIFLPEIGRMIVTDKTMYNTLDAALWTALSADLGRKTLSMRELDDSLYLLDTSFYKGEPTFMIAVQLSKAGMIDRLRMMRGDEATELALRREDGTLFAATKGGAELCALGGELNANNWQVSGANLPVLRLELRCFQPLSDVMEPMLMHHMWIIVLTLTAAVLMTVYLLYYRIFILHPLNTIFESVRRAESTGSFHIDQANSDFDDIFAQFTGMVQRIEELAGRVYEAQFRAQKAELAQLQMQINPHFFYNTLFLIYRMAQADGNDEIARLSLNLSNYYQYITKMPERDVPLLREVQHITNYLEIQRIRFSPRVEVEIDALPEEIAAEELPPLILQPIVENAFVHGVKDKVSGGLVRLSYAYGDDWFRVSVWDNGGMSEERVRELTARLNSGNMEDGSALQNLNRRLELRYGRADCLALECERQGLKVSVTIPGRKGRADAVAVSG